MTEEKSIPEILCIDEQTKILLWHSSSKILNECDFNDSILEAVLKESYDLKLSIEESIYLTYLVVHGHARKGLEEAINCLVNLSDDLSNKSLDRLKSGAQAQTGGIP